MILNNTFSLKWTKKKKSIIDERLSFKDVFNFPYSGRVPACSRDIDLGNLQSSESFRFPGADLQLMVPVFSSKFCPLYSHHDLVAACDEDGNVAILRIKDFENPLEVINTHSNAVFGLEWVPGDTKLLTLSGDHTAKLWDLNERATCLSTFLGHKKSVRTAAFRPQDPATFVTGSRDGSVMLWDSRSHTSVCQPMYHKYDKILENAAAEPNLRNKSKMGATPSVTGVAFQDSNTLFTCGSTDQYIRIWDMRLTYRQGKGSLPKARIKTPRSSFIDLKLSPCGSLLYASSLNGPIYCYNVNASTPQLVATFEGHEAASFFVKIGVSADGRFLVSGSTQGHACVWRTANAHLNELPCQPMVQLKGHTCEVADVDISQHGVTTVVSCSDDGLVKKWTPARNDEKAYEDLKNELSRLNFHWSQDASTQTQSSGINTDFGEGFEYSQPTSDLDELRSPLNNFLTTHRSVSLNRSSLRSALVKQKSAIVFGEDFFSSQQTSDIGEPLSDVAADIEPTSSSSVCVSVDVRSDAIASANNASVTPFGSVCVSSTSCLKNEGECNSAEGFPNREETFGFAKAETPPREVRPDRTECTPTKRGNTSCSKRKWPSSPRTPLSRSCKRLALSPKVNKNSEEEYRSPTMNLPNYVIDGTGPNHRCTRTRQKENRDWLTQMGRLSASKRSESSEKLPGSGEKVSEKGRKARTKNNVKKSSRKTLLNYYKKTSKGADSETN